MSTLKCRTFAAATLVLAAAAAVRADQNNYYVHFTATNMQPGWITAGAFDATPFVPPAGACGMIFENADGKSFILPYDIEGPALPAGDLEILIGTCGGGGVSIDGVDMPSGWDGAIEIEDAYGYWVDGNHNKLVYKHSCAPNCSAADDLYGGYSWHFVSELMVELKSSLAGKRGIRSLEVLLAMSDRYLEKLSRDVATAVTARRAVTAGVLESSVHAQEEDTQTRLGAAGSRLRACRAYQIRGDMKSAVIACDEALNALSLARTAAGVAGTWRAQR